MAKSFILSVMIILFQITGCSKKKRDGVALIINGHEITSTEVRQSAELLKESMASVYPEKVFESDPSDFAAAAAQQLIANRLLIEEAGRLGIEADSKAVDSAYSILEKRFPDRAAFKEEIIKMGETDSSFRKQIENGIRLDALINRLLSSSSPVDTQECREFYEKNKARYTDKGHVRARQIFFPFPDSVSDTKKAELYEKAVKVRRLLLNGADFAENAKKYSGGPGAREGGDIGWFSEGDLRPDLEEPLFKLKKGEISDIVATDIGLFILQKTDEEAPKQLTYEQVENRIRFLLEIRRRNRIIGRHIDSLKAKANIEYIDTTLARSNSAIGMETTD